MLEGEENYQFIRHVNCLDDCEELIDSSFLFFFIVEYYVKTRYTIAVRKVRLWNFYRQF